MAAERSLEPDRRPADTGTDLEAGANMRFPAIPAAHNDAIVARVVRATCREMAAQAAPDTARSIFASLLVLLFHLARNAVPAKPAPPAGAVLLFKMNLRTACVNRDLITY